MNPSGVRHRSEGKSQEHTGARLISPWGLGMIRSLLNPRPVPRCGVCTPDTGQASCHPYTGHGRLAVKNQSAHHREEPKVRVTLSLHGHHATGWQTQRPVPQNMWKELKIFPPSSYTQLGSQSFCFPCGAINSSQTSNTATCLIHWTLDY